MDTQSAEASWKEVPLLGKAPDPRMAFSTVMVNSTTLLLYGGTDDFKSAFWVTFYLDLPTWTWSSPEAQGTIPRRWGHTATMVGKTMVVVFGKEQTTNNGNNVKQNAIATTQHKPGKSEKDLFSDFKEMGEKGQEKKRRITRQG